MQDIFGKRQRVALFNDIILCQDNAASVAGEYNMSIKHWRKEENKQTTIEVLG